MAERALPFERSCSFPELDDFAGKKVAIRICDHYLGKYEVVPMDRTAGAKTRKTLKKETSDEN